ncbi:hypothetical protein [Sulfuricurvum sp.]|uniref:hypothetical protein n=1 Tax=Sulfuricurvum sp. TaxID=2025608 RepID=UPI00260D8D5A|nr:hypothetical protein [Sulfuricurvum sp.]MDD3594907.1 hypothetical protein [Sulfuricurvum sp.]
MSHFDMDMMAIMGLMLLLGGFILTFLKEMIVPMVGLFLLLLMVWGDDICSRNDRLNFYGDHFDRGGEVVCKDNNAQPILISKLNSWEHKGEYLFKGNRGVEILEDQCEIINQSEPHCISVTTQIIIGTTALIGIFGWMFWMFRRINDIRKKTKARQERKEKIIQGAKEMAELYKTDPELKEWNEFAGDHFEEVEQYTQEDHNVEKNV